MGRSSSAAIGILGAGGFIGMLIGPYLGDLILGSAGRDRNDFVILFAAASGAIVLPMTLLPFLRSSATSSRSTQVRLVRIHRWRAGMFEVYEFADERLPPELRERVSRQGGWRDLNRQWYDLVESAEAKRLEVLRRSPSSNPECAWQGWARLRPLMR